LEKTCAESHWQWPSAKGFFFEKTFAERN
jgi:hypothetical protein